MRKVLLLVALMGLSYWNGIWPVAALSTASTPEACTVVELLPGYPGYRGYLTGLVVQPDRVCLEELTQANPTFDRYAAIAKIQDRARYLGISGSFVDWTWETWMAIDVSLGNPPICYSCLWLNPTSPLPVVEAPDLSDYRVQLGRFGERNIALRFAADNNLDASIVASAPSDDQLRAIVGMANPGRYLIAVKVLATAYSYLESYYCTGASPCGTLDNGILNSIRKQGGYVPTPSSALDEDQGYLVLEGIFTVASIGMNPVAGSALIEKTYAEYSAWHVLDRPKPRFAEHLSELGLIP